MRPSSETQEHWRKCAKLRRIGLGTPQQHMHWPTAFPLRWSQATLVTPVWTRQASTSTLNSDATSRKLARAGPRYLRQKKRDARPGKKGTLGLLTRIWVAKTACGKEGYDRRTPLISSTPKTFRDKKIGGYDCRTPLLFLARKSAQESLDQFLKLISLGWIDVFDADRDASVRWIHRNSSRAARGACDADTVRSIICWG